MPSYPYTVDNGSGEHLTFLGRSPGESGERLEVEVRAQVVVFPPGVAHKWWNAGSGELEIPTLVQKKGFPMLVAIGSLIGKYRRFAGAPNPVQVP